MKDVGEFTSIGEVGDVGDVGECSAGIVSRRGPSVCLNPANSDCRRVMGFLSPCAVESLRERLRAGVSGIFVTNFVKLAIARKQNFAGVLNENRMGRMCGLSSYTCSCTGVGLPCSLPFRIGYSVCVRSSTGYCSG